MFCVRTESFRKKKQPFKQKIGSFSPFIGQIQLPSWIEHVSVPQSHSRYNRSCMKIVGHLFLPSKLWTIERRFFIMVQKTPSEISTQFLFIHTESARIFGVLLRALQTICLWLEREKEYITYTQWPAWWLQLNTAKTQMLGTSNISLIKEREVKNVDCWLYICEYGATIGIAIISLFLWFSDDFYFKVHVVFLSVKLAMIERPITVTRQSDAIVVTFKCNSSLCNLHKHFWVFLWKMVSRNCENIRSDEGNTYKCIKCVNENNTKTWLVMER